MYVLCELDRVSWTYYRRRRIATKSTACPSSHGFPSSKDSQGDLRDRPPNARDNKTLSFNPRQSTKHLQTQTKHPKGPGNPTNARRTAKIGLKSGKNRSKQNFQSFSNFSPPAPQRTPRPLKQSTRCQRGSKTRRTLLPCATT